MADTPKYYVRFWMPSLQQGTAPNFHDVNHDGPLASAILVADADLAAGNHAGATHYTIYDYKTDRQVHP